MSLTKQRTGRAKDELRPVTIETGVAPYAEGSALIAFGDTRVWCTASVDERVPPWLARIIHERPGLAARRFHNSRPG